MGRNGIKTYMAFILYILHSQVLILNAYLHRIRGRNPNFASSFPFSFVAVTRLHPEFDL